MARTSLDSLCNFMCVTIIFFKWDIPIHTQNVIPLVHDHMTSAAFVLKLMIKSNSVYD